MSLHAAISESTYDAWLRYQLTKDGINFAHQVRLPIMYDGVQLEAAYRIDFIVANCIIVELKAVGIRRVIRN